MNEHKIVECLKYLGFFSADNSYVQGGFFMNPCPFAKKLHNSGVDRNSSFGIKIDNAGRSFYNCFTCGQKGPFYRLPDQYARVVLGSFTGNSEGVIYILKQETAAIKENKVEIPSRLTSLDSQDPINESIYKNIYTPAWQNASAREYLQSRGVTEKASILLDLKYDSEERRALFPIRDTKSNLYGFTGRSILPSKFLGGAPKVPKIRDYEFKKKCFILGEHLFQKGKPIILVEGLFALASLISIHALDQYNILALMGVELSAEKMQKLLSLKSAVYLLLDNDFAGKRATHTIYTSLLDKCPVFKVPWPTNRIDPDELSLAELNYMISLIHKKPDPINRYRKLLTN